MSGRSTQRYGWWWWWWSNLWQRRRCKHRPGLSSSLLTYSLEQQNLISPWCHWLYVTVINLLPVLHHHFASKLCPCQTDISETNTELNDSSNLSMCTHKRHIWLQMRLSQYMRRWPNYRLEKSLHKMLHQRNCYCFFHPGVKGCSEIFWKFIHFWKDRLS